MSLEIKEMTSEEVGEMMTELRRLNPELPIRNDIRAALDRWAFQRVLPGDFLQSVLANDLMDAMGRADSYNRATLYQICTYIYNELPHKCHGSREIMDEWVAKAESGE